MSEWVAFISVIVLGVVSGVSCESIEVPDGRPTIDRRSRISRRLGTSIGVGGGTDDDELAD